MGDDRQGEAISNPKITAFVALSPDDSVEGVGGGDAKLLGVAVKVDGCSDVLRGLETDLIDSGYEVQTVRIATNPFGEWLTTEEEGGNDVVAGPTTTRRKRKRTDDDGPEDDDDATTTKTKTTIASIASSGDGGCPEVRRKLRLLDDLLAAGGIGFCSLGPSTNPRHTTDVCPVIIASSGRFSCSVNVDMGDVRAARAASECMVQVSTLEGDGDHVRGGLGNC
jgi:hypothetical protein